jgi:hypothetical protein
MLQSLFYRLSTMTDDDPTNTPITFEYFTHTVFLLRMPYLPTVVDMYRAFSGISSGRDLRPLPHISGYFSVSDQMNDGSC